jgi:excisionase family DNA binding protein
MRERSMISNNHDGSKLLRPDEVADMLGFTRGTVYRWISRGWMCAVILKNRRIRVRTSEVGRFMHESEAAQESEQMHKIATESARPRMIRIDTKG